VLFPELNQLYAYGAPMGTPSLKEMLNTHQQVAAAANLYLDALTGADLLSDLLLNGKPVGQSMGSALQRITYHYWYHLGEIQAIRQMLGHTHLPEYVGDIDVEAPYRPE
jgi:hypothetical protein